MLEATYAERANEEEPTRAGGNCAPTLETERDEQAMLADSATHVFGQQSQEDAEGLLTRRKGAPTRDVILLRACEMIDRDRWRITPLEGEPFLVSGYEWSLDAARALHRHLVRAPLHTVPPQSAPLWLSLHVHSGAAWALVQADGACHFPDAEGAIGARLLPAPRPPHPRPINPNPATPKTTMNLTTDPWLPVIAADGAQRSALPARSLCFRA